MYVAGASGVIMSEEDGGWRIHDTHTLDDIWSIWGFSDDDVWAGTGNGNLLHWNGTDWQQVEWPSEAEHSEPEYCSYRGDPIRGMWGIDSVLYFHTGNQIGVWDGAEFSILGHWPGEDVWYPEIEGHDCINGVWINAIWGNSPDEVFFAVSAASHATEDCAPQILLWWDGSEFHWF